MDGARYEWCDRWVGGFRSFRCTYGTRPTPCFVCESLSLISVSSDQVSRLSLWGDMWHGCLWETQSFKSVDCLHFSKQHQQHFSCAELRTQLPRTGTVPPIKFHIEK